MKRIIVICIALLVSLLGFSQDLAYAGDFNEEISVNEASEQLLFYRPMNVFEDPSLFNLNFTSKTIPVELYSSDEIEIQKELNSKEEAIVTFSGGDNRFFPRRLDREEITPYTWKWVHLQVKEEDGSFTNIHLRRPNWWFLENHATSVGDNVHINIPQIGLEKNVSIIKIYPNQLDTRFWESQGEESFKNRPITGKVEHSVNNVVNLHFNEEDSKPLSVTKNHLLWSHDRDDWVKVEDLRVDEKVTTKNGTLSVRERIDKEGWYIVYDLEVYKDHNFLVGGHDVLAHNGCNKRTGATHNGFYEVKKAGTVEYAGKGPAGRSKTSKKAKGGDVVVHYEIDAKIADKLGFNVKDAAFIMEYKLGVKRAKELFGDKADFKSLKYNGKSMSPGFKKYSNLSDAAKEKVDAAFEQILSGGGTQY